jgi:hypothetical protein
MIDVPPDQRLTRQPIRQLSVVHSLARPTWVADRHLRSVQLGMTVILVFQPGARRLAILVQENGTASEVTYRL